MNNLKILRVLALFEGISFLVILGVTMPLKYMYDNPTPNQVIGYIHGLLFMAYIVWVVLAGTERNWSKSYYFWSIVASVVPFGTFVADVKLFRENTQA